MPVTRAGSLPPFQVGEARFEPLTDGARPGAELAVWRLTVTGDAPGAPHVIDREEVFVCTSGTLLLNLDGEPQVLGPGDTASAPAGTRIAASARDEPATAMVCCRLGLTATMADGTELRPPWAQPA